jgi:hypothetical protein
MEPSAFNEFLASFHIACLRFDIGNSQGPDLLPAHLLVISKDHFAAIGLHEAVLLRSALNCLEHKLQGWVERGLHELDAQLREVWG